MNPQKLTKTDAQVINLGTKTIHSYPLKTRTLSVAYMVVKGRHPENQNKFLLEHDCQFIINVTKGTGTIYAGNEKYDVKTGDVIYVPNDNKFSAEGDMEYVTADSPGYYPEQSTEIDEK
jgi:mannose-6-phosphate isomerase-like protein (cupin superfamily)